MKWLFFAKLLILFTLTVNVTTASAHLIGQPSFFKVNGQYSLLYTVPTTSLPDFELPQDMNAENYEVNKPINFELDETRLPAPPEVIKKTRFDWDFGDGTTGSGLALAHTYTKPGSYMLSIMASDDTTPTPQLLQLVVVNVVPYSDYKLPVPFIKINNEIHKDLSNNVTQFSFSKPINFDAKNSLPGSTPIRSYQWDFGDGTSSDKPNVSHDYKSNLYQTYVILRVVDQNGLIVDNYIEVQDADLDQTQEDNQSGLIWNSNKVLIPIITVTIILLGGLIFLLIKNRQR